MNDDRRRLLWLGALPSLVALVVAAGLWLLVHGNAGARDDYDAGKYADARATFAEARDLGVVSPWISPFDAGTAAYGEKDYKAAVRYFKQALPLVPDDRGCDVRINLALTHEAIAEEAGTSGEKAARQVALRDARTVIGGTGCSEAIEKRIEEKIKQSSTSPNDVKSEQQKQDEVEKRNREAKKAKDVELEPKNEPDQQIQW